MILLDATTPTPAPAAPGSDLDAVDWERRLREDRAIGLKLLSMPSETGPNGQIIGYSGGMQLDELVYVVAVKCDDGTSRTLSLEAALKRGHRVAHEVQTVRGKAVGGKEDVAPMPGGAAEIASTVATFASLFGHPAAGAAVATIVAAGGNLESMPVGDLVAKLKAVLR